jgi:hypothetical protein
VLWLWDADNGEWINRWQALDIWLWITDLTVIYTTIPITQDGVTISPPGVQITPENPAQPQTPEPDETPGVTEIIVLLTAAVVGIGVLIGSTAYRIVRGAWEVSV